MKLAGKYPIELELTNVCGLSCKYCINKELIDKGFITESLFIDIINYIYNNRKDILYLNLSGVGDIFLHPKIDRFLLFILKKFKHTGFKILIATKGNTLKSSTLNLLKRFKYYNIEIVLSFGIFSMNDTNHDKFVGKEGSLKKTLKKIFLVKKLGIPFSMEIIYSKYSVDTINIYETLCKELDIDPIVHSLHNFGGRIDISNELFIGKSKTNCSFDELGNSDSKFYNSFSNCGFIPFIDYQGKINLCSLDAHQGKTFYDFNEIKDINYLNIVSKLKSKIIDCGECSLNKNYEKNQTNG